MHAYRYERKTRCYTILGDLPLGVANTEDVVLSTQTQTQTQTVATELIGSCSSTSSEEAEIKYFSLNVK